MVASNQPIKIDIDTINKIVTEWNGLKTVTQDY